MAEELTVGGYEPKNCVVSGATTQIWEVNEPGSATQLAMKLLLDDVRQTDDPGNTNLYRPRNNPEKAGNTTNRHVQPGRCTV